MNLKGRGERVGSQVADRQTPTKVRSRLIGAPPTTSVIGELCSCPCCHYEEACCQAPRSIDLSHFLGLTTEEHALSYSTAIIEFNYHDVCTARPFADRNAPAIRTCDRQRLCD